MFKNHLKIAFRNFLKHKSFSVINVAGLAVGMACFILIVLYVQYELSFDRYHEHAGRIYRVVAHQPGNIFLGSDHFAVTQAILGKTLKAEFPEVLNAVTLNDASEILFSIGERSFYEFGLLWADAELFEIFTFPLLIGDPQIVLAEPFSMVISEELAQKYFGDENPIGKIIRYLDKHDFKVTGVMKDVPKNSHFHFQMVTSFQTLMAISENKRQFTTWGTNSYYTYILVPPDFDPKEFEAKLVQLVKKYRPNDWGEGEEPHRYYLQPVTEIHLYSHINFDIARNNDIRYIYLLSGLALIILLIACINYMNLTTARASLRAKEVGMRKVVGASRMQLLKQFVGESMLLTVAAALLALLIVELLLPTFSKLVEREFSFGLFLQAKLVIGLVLAAVLVGIISGSYPALFLTAFQPAKVLKGEVREGGRSRLRSGLVIFQFAASVALILCTAVVQKQMNYIKHKKLGYNREQVLVTRMRDREARQKFDLIKRELLENPNNEKLRDMLGWGSAVGKPFGRDEQPDGTIIGVMKNFHLHSFREEIHPLFIQMNKDWSWYASARIRTEDLSGAIEHAREVWEKYAPKYPFEYFFFDDEFNRMYKTEEKLGEIFGYFTVLAIFIACLGLFGLASFTAERKTKEIGIRKVLGASVGQLLVLLSKDFTRLVLAANLIAWPVAWYAMTRWLQGFAYRTSMGAEIFLLTAATALVIALITVSVQTVKAAMANPVEALRYE